MAPLSVIGFSVSVIPILFSTSFTPGGVGVTQAWNVASLNGVASSTDATAYSVAQQLVQAGKVLDIPVQDHVIIGRGRYISFAEAGLL